MPFCGDMLLHWRAIEGLSQSKAAEMVNISQNYWHSLEHGKKVPSLKLLEVISEVTGLRKSALLGERDKSGAFIRAL